MNQGASPLRRAVLCSPHAEHTISEPTREPRNCKEQPSKETTFYYFGALDAKSIQADSQHSKMQRMVEPREGFLSVRSQVGHFI